MAPRRRTPDPPPLHLVADTSSTIPAPPRPLGKHGMALWEAVHDAYRIDDAGGVELLAQCCATADRAEQLAEQIERDGVAIHTKAGPPKDHPLIKHELAARAFVCRTL